MVPASKAGIKEGDVITLMDSSLITSTEDLLVVIDAHKAGDKIALRYVRGGNNVDVSVTLGST
jgi:S1-C subfamily serine protease